MSTMYGRETSPCLCRVFKILTAQRNPLQKKILTGETCLPQGCSGHGHTILKSLAAKPINSVQKWRTKQLFCPDRSPCSRGCMSRIAVVCVA